MPGYFVVVPAHEHPEARFQAFNNVEDTVDEYQALLSAGHSADDIIVIMGSVAEVHHTILIVDPIAAKDD